jgi:hypothetical protein
MERQSSRTTEKFHFYRDVYGHDASLEAALAKGYPYP